MNTYIEGLKWAVIILYSLAILLGSANVGKKQEPYTWADYITKSIVWVVVIFLLIRGS